MSERSLRSRSTPVREVNETTGVNFGEPLGDLRQDTTRGRVRGRGRGRGRVPQRATTQVGEADTGTRGRGRARGNRRTKSVEIPGGGEMSLQESSATVRGRGLGRGRGRGGTQAFVTQETFVTEMGKLQEALNALRTHQESSASGSKDKSESKGGSEMSSSPVLGVGGHSQSTTILVNESAAKGCNYKAFSSCKPPTYKGECEPVLAMKWIREMELVFDTCKCAEGDKVMFALSMLKSDAIFWWDAETGGKGSSAAKSMSWEEFVVKFKAQFCPLAAIKKLEEEFLRLEQGEMTVREYTSKFLERARFAEVYVPTEERRIERYIYGLRSSIRELTSARNPTTFQAAINAAEMTEKEKNRQVVEKVGDKRKWEGPGNDPKRERESLGRTHGQIVH